MQDLTELAETPGSRYVAECVTLISEGRFSQLLDRLLSQADLVFSKSSEKGQLQQIGPWQRMLPVPQLLALPAGRQLAVHQLVWLEQPPHSVHILVQTWSAASTSSATSPPACRQQRRGQQHSV